MSKPRPKIGIVGSSGGHLFQLYTLQEWWTQFDRFWVTFDKPDAVSLLEIERKYFAHFPTNRNLVNLVRNFFLAAKILRREKPDVLVSTGAALAFPFFILGKMMGAKLVFIEVFDRLDSPTLTGKLVYPFCDKFLIQWEEQRQFYPQAEFWGQTL